MGETDVLKPWRKLPEVINWMSGDWTWGRGGRLLNERQFFIAYTHKDLHQDVYILPDYMGEMLRRGEEYGAEQVKREIKNILGL